MDVVTSNPRARDQKADGAPSAARRRATPRAETAPRRQPRWKGALLTIVLMAASTGVGVFLTRRHYKAQQVVASVNGALITQQDFYGRLEEQSGPGVLRGMVGEQLVLQYARKEGVLPTDAQVEARFKELTSRPGYSANGRSPDAVKRAIRVSLAQQAVLDRGINVTDADVRKVYEKNVDPKNPLARFYTPEAVQIAVIVTRTEADSRQALRSLYSGMPFATAAKTYSKDNSRANGGLLPPTLRGRTRTRTIPGLEPALFAMKIGQQMGPRQFAGAWWIIRCVDKKPAVTLPFEQVKNDCRSAALLEKGLPANAAKTQEAFADFQKHANIRAFWTRYDQAVRTQ